ncbi:hypothetical protein N7475_003915 [Penicillium sp. IBT 31633x]|nr:hypothetical protein N7475_003915 [Penicillium sp. IBT 31633x]
MGYGHVGPYLQKKDRVVSLETLGNLVSAHNYEVKLESILPPSNRSVIQSRLPYDNIGLQEVFRKSRFLRRLTPFTPYRTNLKNGHPYASRISFRHQTPFRRRTNRRHCSNHRIPSRKDYCLSVIWFPPREYVDIRLLIATPFQRTSNVGVGSLDRLPLELLFDIFCRLDMHSLFKFRQINLRSRQMVDSLHQYQSIVSYGLNLFYTLLRTRVAIYISLLDFYNALCTKACSLYGEFGGFMSLLIWKRCCFKCL